VVFASCESGNYATDYDDGGSGCSGNGKWYWGCVQGV